MGAWMALRLSWPRKHGTVRRAGMTDRVLHAGWPWKRGDGRADVSGIRARKTAVFQEGRMDAGAEDARHVRDA